MLRDRDELVLDGRQHCLDKSTSFQENNLIWLKLIYLRYNVNVLVILKYDKEKKEEEEKPTRLIV